MRRYKVTWALGAILLIIFGGLLLGQYYYFYSAKPTFPEQIEEVVVAAKEENWSQADEKLKKVEDKWKKSYPLIAIKYADQEYTFLNLGFEALRAGVDAQNIHAVTKEGKVCVKLFKNITSISSKP